MDTVCVDPDFEDWWICDASNAVFFNFRHLVSDQQEARDLIRDAFGNKDIESMKAVPTNDGRCILRVIFAIEPARRTALERMLLCKDKEVQVVPAVPSANVYTYMVIRLREIPVDGPLWVMAEEIEESVPYFFRHWEAQYKDFIRIEDIVVEDIDHHHHHHDEFYDDYFDDMCEATVAIVLDGNYYIPKKDKADGEAFVAAYDDFFPFEVEYGYKTYCQQCKVLNGHSLDDCPVYNEDD